MASLRTVKENLEMLKLIMTKLEPKEITWLRKVFVEFYIQFGDSRLGPEESVEEVSRRRAIAKYVLSGEGRLKHTETNNLEKAKGTSMVRDD